LTSIIFILEQPENRQNAEADSPALISGLVSNVLAVFGEV